MRVKILFIIISCMYTCLYAQFKIPMKQPKSFYLRIGGIYNGKLIATMESGMTVYDQKQIIQKVSFDLVNKTYEIKDVFNKEFYATELKDKKLEDIEHLDEFIILSASTSFLGTGGKRCFYVYNKNTDDYFKFDIDITDRLLMTVCWAIKNVNDHANELVFISNESNESYITTNEKQNRYKITRIDLDTKEITRSEYDQDKKEFAISRIYSKDNTSYCLVKLVRNTNGFLSTKSEALFALFNLENFETIPITIESNQKYVDEAYAKPVDGGLIFSISLADENQTNEVHLIGISYADGEVKTIKKYPYNIDDYWSKPFAFLTSSRFTINNQRYQWRFEDKKLFISKVSLHEITTVEYEIGEETGYQRLLKFNEKEAVFYSDKSSDIGGKRLLVTAQLSTNQVEVEVIDKNSIPRMIKEAYEPTSYFYNGNDHPIYYKWDKDGLIVEQELPE